MTHISKQLSRRELMRLLGIGAMGVAGTSLLAACGDATATAGSSPPSSATPAMGAGMDLTPTGAMGDKMGANMPKMLRFGVGPLQPTPADSKKAYEPFFKYLADKLGTQYDLVATTDWAGISVALANDQIDVAWMGPWGYVLANNSAGAQAIATVKYDEKPLYHAIVVARPGLTIKTWPDDGKGLKISFADVGSTSGWLIPTYWFKTKGIDPKTYFQYSEGSTHAANETAVANSQVDLATDYDRNRTAMIESGKLDAAASNIVWTSDPLPNDAIAVKNGFDAGLTTKIQQIILAITPEEAKTILPKHYTGFVAATDKNYESIKAAGIAVGKIKAKS